MEIQHEDTTNNYTNLDQTYNYCFVDDDDFMLFDCGLIGQEPHSTIKDLAPTPLTLDTVSGSQELSLCLDDSGGGLLSEGLEGFREENRDDGDSYAAMTRIRRDRSKTLVSERKRRVRMKEKLYELRSLVPNITKMDKASIIADAVEYVKDLKSQAKKLEEEIVHLETSSKAHQVPQNLLKNTTRVEEAIAFPHGGKILQLNAIKVGDRRFFLTIECENKDSVASLVYSAIESLVFFHLECSNFSSASDRFVLSLIFNVEKFDEEMEMEASTMKLWFMSALLKEGFEFVTIVIA